MSQMQKLGPNSGGAVGDVIGPASSTDNAIARWNGTTGKLLQDSEQRIVEGTATTSGAVTGDLITLALGGTAATYTINALIAGFESTTPAGAGYKVLGIVRTDGATATVVGVPDVNGDEEAALTGADANIVASGNNAIVRVTGVALLDINWVASAQFIEVT